MKVGVIGQTQLEHFLNAEDDRILVIIQQNGGNDGLNTIIPIDQFDNLSRARQSLLIPEQQILPLTENTGMHPVMDDLQALFKEGKLNIIQNVGYANQNRSHFRSTDIWDSGSTAEEVRTTGWMGRYLDLEHPGYPENYPNDDTPHPIAITLGPTVSESCQGMAANFSLAINDPTALVQIPGTETEQLPDLPYGYELAFLQQIIAQNNVYAEILSDAAEQGKNQSDLYDESRNNSLATQLRTVAQLISGGLQTKVYVVNINGFDTHANQVEDGSPFTGTHANLLQELSQSIYAFMDDLRNQGLDQRVIGITRSEFGRQIRENGSFGTDHGDAAPLMIFGTCVKGGIIGENPIIPQDFEPQSGVEAKIDFKNIFGSVLMDWFGADASSVQSIFSHDFEYIPVIDACNTTPTKVPKFNPVADVTTYPNPFFDQMTVQFNSRGEDVNVSIYSLDGKLVKRVTHQYFESGTHTVPVRLDNAPPGQYICRLISNGYQVSKSIIHF